MVTALPISTSPLPKHIVSNFTMNNSPNSPLKRPIQAGDPYVSSATSPSKRASPSEMPSSSSTPSARQIKPIRSALSSRSSPSSTAAAISALKSVGDGYRQGMYLAYINNALSEKSKGNLGPYLELVTQFQISSTPNMAPNSSPTQLRSWLSALSHVVSTLDRSHSQLIDNILTLPWTTMNESFAHMWIKFVCSLVSARGEWLGNILHRAVKSLSYRSDGRALAVLGLSTTDNTSQTRRQIYDRIHLLLRSLLALIPTLPSMLAPLLVKHFPHKRESRAIQLMYVKNILEISQYCAELSEGILSAIIDRAIQLDVEIQVEIDDLDDEDEEALDLEFKDPFEQALDEGDDSDEESDIGDIDNLSDLSSEGGFSDEELKPDAMLADDDPKKGFSRIQGLVGRLDSIMLAAFEHLQRLDTQYSAAIDGRVILSSSSPMVPLSPAQAELNRRNLFHTLLAIFSRAMLPTFKSRHVQFLLFWFNSLDPEFSDLFLGVLLSKSLYGGVTEEPAIIRSAAASYVASFVSRANYVDGPTSRVVVLNLCAFMDAHMEASNNPETEIASAPPGSGTHAVYYAVCQAIFYIFCFRWRDLKLMPEEQVDENEELDHDADEDVVGLHSSIGALSQQAASSWCEGLNVVQRAITSHLNPLKYCSATVVKQFARIAQHTGFLYCYSIIEANNRSGRVRSRTWSGMPCRTTSTNIIDSVIARGDTSSEGSDSGTPRPCEAGSSRRLLPDPIPMGTDLEAFFPFDPYKLRTSGTFVGPLYREWSHVAPEQDDDSDQDEPDTQEEESGGMAIPRASSQAEGDGDEFVSQVAAMSISPYRG